MKDRIDEYITIFVLLTVLQLAHLLTVGWLGTGVIALGYVIGDLLITGGKKAVRKLRKLPASNKREKKTKKETT